MLKNVADRIDNVAQKRGGIRVNGDYYEIKMNKPSKFSLISDLEYCDVCFWNKKTDSYSDNYRFTKAGEYVYRLSKNDLGQDDIRPHPPCSNSSYRQSWR